MKRMLTVVRGSKLSVERGQTIVEFALVLPILVILLMGVLQGGVSLHDYISMTDAARVGARAAAVQRTNSPCAPNGAARTAIEKTLSKRQWDDISGAISCTAGANVGDPIKVSITYTFKIDWIGISQNLTTSATERLE